MLACICRYLFKNMYMYFLNYILYILSILTLFYLNTKNSPKLDTPLVHVCARAYKCGMCVCVCFSAAHLSAEPAAILLPSVDQEHLSKF